MLVLASPRDGERFTDNVLGGLAPDPADRIGPDGREMLLVEDS